MVTLCKASKCGDKDSFLSWILCLLYDHNVTTLMEISAP